MSDAVIAAQIGKAWALNRERRFTDAVREFENILKSAPEDVDALYGLGLALKNDHQNEAAIKIFQKVYKMTQDAAFNPQAVDVHAQGHMEDTLHVQGQNDRFLMLTRMIKQRLAELNAQPEEA